MGGKTYAMNVQAETNQDKDKRGQSPGNCHRHIQLAYVAHS